MSVMYRLILMSVVVFLFSCSQESKKKSNELNAEKSINKEFIALDFLLDSLIEKRGLLYEKDSFYLNLGLEEELSDLLNYPKLILNSCNYLITRSINFSDNSDIIEEDSIKKLAIGFEENYKVRSSKTNKLELATGIKIGLVENLSDSTLFVTLRNYIEAENITQIEINVCIKKLEEYSQYNFYFFLDENDNIFYWEFLEEYSLNNTKECATCFPTTPIPTRPRL